MTNDELIKRFIVTNTYSLYIINKLIIYHLFMDNKFAFFFLVLLALGCYLLPDPIA